MRIIARIVAHCHGGKRQRKRQVRRRLPGPVACQRLTDGPWLALTVAGVIASAIGKTPASEPRCVAIAPRVSRLTDGPWQAFCVAGVAGVIASAVGRMPASEALCVAGSG
jgi:hypothetical protein